MKNKIPHIPLGLCIGIILCLFENQVDAQVYSVKPAESESVARPTSFTEVVDSKIDRNDVGIIRQLIEKSEHSGFLKSSETDKIYIMDLDQFRDGMPNFQVFGKDVIVMTKYDVIDANVPFFITIDGYNKQQNTCEAVVSMHKNIENGETSISKKIILKKSTDTWSEQN